MCLLKCQKKIAKTLNRRQFIKTVSIAGAATVVASTLVSAKTNKKSEVGTTINFTKVIDLNHKLNTKFPTFTGEQWFDVETIFTFEKDGFNMKKWIITEHVGTHLDAPFHFSNKLSADSIEPDNLVGHLAVIDIKEKADKNSDAQLTPIDIKKWEQKHGRLPEGAIVAMNSGWDKYVNSPKFRGEDSKKVVHFPGFHLETVDMLLEERNVKGIFVDTLSLDYGISENFAVHYKWLPANRWGMECVANLDKMPAKGATVVIGAPAIEGATGGPTRILALV